MVLKRQVKNLQLSNQHNLQVHQTNFIMMLN